MCAAETGIQAMDDREIAGTCEGNAGAFARSGQVAAVLGMLDESGLAALVAGPGMGKSTLASQVGAARKQMGHDVRELAGDPAPTKMLQQLTRFARSAVVAAQRGHAVTVVIDDIPAFDERQANRFKRALGRMREGGCDVLLALRPESMQAIEDLGRSVRIMWASRMLMGPEELEAIGLPKAAIAPALELTAGIPTLVRALARLRPEAVVASRIPAPSPYDSALAKLIGRAVRADLMREERQMRLTMLLLGEGELADLVAGREEQAGELLLEMAGSDPIFGIDIIGGTFKVVGSSRMAASRACARALGRAAADEPDIAADALDQLVIRREFERAGFVASLGPDDEATRRLVLAHAMDFVDAGHVPLIRHACGLDVGEGEGTPHAIWEPGDVVPEELKAALDASMPATFPMGVARCAIAALGGFDDSYEAIRKSLPEPRGALERRQLVLLDDLHRALEADRRALFMSVPARSSTGMSSRLRRHVLVRGLMAQGRIDEAYGELLDAGVGSGPLTLSAALLLCDFEWARLIVGDEAARGDADMSEVVAFFARAGLHDHAGYCQELVGSARALRRGHRFHDAQDACIRRADRRGDALLLAVACLGAATMDMRRTGYLRAHLRAERALEAARAAGAPFQTLVAQLLCAMSSHALGEAPATVELDLVSARGWREVAELVVACVRGEGSLPAVVRRLPEAGAPGGADIILDIALRHLGEASARLAALLPSSWRPALSSARDGGEGADGEPSTSGPAAPPAILEVRLLGGFEVLRGGEPIPLASWERASAQALLALLCATRGHKVMRFDVLEMLWPETDFVRGRGSVYTTLSSLRATIGQDEGGPCYVLGREELVLDTAYVRCDVDELETLGIRVLSGEGGDEQVVANCERMQQLYRGDLQIPHVEDAHMLLARQLELRELYVDAMVCGAEAALELGEGRKAVWFARSARSADSLREDAIMLLVRACASEGRLLEARREYESYADRLIEVASIPPSRSLRALAGELGIVAGSASRSEPRELLAAIG